MMHVLNYCLFLYFRHRLYKRQNFSNTTTCRCKLCKLEFFQYIFCQYSIIWIQLTFYFFNFIIRWSNYKIILHNMIMLCAVHTMRWYLKKIEDLLFKIKSVFLFNLKFNPPFSWKSSATIIESYNKTARSKRMFSISRHIFSLNCRRLGYVFFSDLVFLKIEWIVLT